MRLAKTLEDLPVGTPVECRSGDAMGLKGLVCERPQLCTWYSYVKILYTNGLVITYYEADFLELLVEIMIVEKK